MGPLEVSAERGNGVGIDHAVMRKRAIMVGGQGQKIQRLIPRAVGSAGVTPRISASFLLWTTLRCLSLPLLGVIFAGRRGFDSAACLGMATQLATRRNCVSASTRSAGASSAMWCPLLIRWPRSFGAHGRHTPSTSP
jgi:hypothetical protein